MSAFEVILAAVRFPVCPGQYQSGYVGHMSSSAGPQRETEVLRLQVDTFYQVNRFISSIDNLEDLLTLIMQEAEAEASCIALYDPEDNRLHIKFASGEESESVRHLSQAIEQGIFGAAASTNTFVLVEDAQNDPR